MVFKIRGIMDATDKRIEEAFDRYLISLKYNAKLMTKGEFDSMREPFMAGVGYGMSLSREIAVKVVEEMESYTLSMGNHKTRYIEKTCAIKRIQESK
jgi:hypothetical protein